jgi:hypothetical protein
VQLSVSAVGACPSAAAVTHSVRRYHTKLHENLLDPKIRKSFGRKIRKPFGSSKDTKTFWMRIQNKDTNC